MPRLRGLLRIRSCILPRYCIGNIRQVRDLAAGSVGDVDVRVLQEQAGGAIELEAGLLIRGFGRNQIGFGCGQSGCVLQDCGLRGETDFEFLLIGAEGLACQVYC